MVEKSSHHPKAARLLKRWEFQRVRKLSKDSHVGRYLILDYCSSVVAGRTRLGITVTRRFGNAVQRNRAKRLIREAFRLSSLPPGLDLHIRPRHAIRDAKTPAVQRELASLLLKAYLQ